MSDAKNASAPDTIKHVVIGTAGHVDHGKTTLVGALTGTNTDRLAEEQARGMTIDLGFAFLQLPGMPPVQAGIVDVPGHERFVKNMLAGAGGIDVALIVVAADEGPMPQTREHLDVLTVLGVAHGVVALTKCDVADEDLQALAAETTREALAQTPLADVPIVSVSAQTGQGLEQLIEALARGCREAPDRQANGPVRLPVDRVFSVPGAGTVVTGTLVSGTLRAGDALTVMPHDITTKARSLQTHNERIETAFPGMRVAANLPGVEVAQFERGAVLCTPGSLQPSTLFDARLSLLPDAPRALKNRERVRLHLGTGETLARVQLLNRSEAQPGATDIPTQFLCETPVAPARNERFVVRIYSPARVIGGGIVLDPVSPSRRRKNDEAALAVFAAQSGGKDTEAVYGALLSRHQEWTAKELSGITGLSEESTQAALKALASESRAEILSNGNAIADATGVRLRETARRALSNFHRQNPLRRAMPREGLRAPLPKAAQVEFGAALGWLAAKGDIVLEGNTGVRLPEHSVILPPQWEKAKNEIIAVFEEAGLNPPNPANFQAHLPRDVNVRAILGVLVDEGRLVPLGDELYIPTDTLNGVTQLVRKLAAQPGGVSVATVRNATGSSRKIILPLMEYFDAQRITRRQGDVRVLVEGS